MPTINKCLYRGVKHLLSYTYQGVNKWVKQEFNEKKFSFISLVTIPFCFLRLSLLWMIC